MLADLLLENGEAVEALREYKVVLRIAPRRFNATQAPPGPPKGRDTQPNPARTRGKLLEITGEVDTSRPAAKLADVDGNASPEVLLYNKINAVTYLGKATTPGKFAFTGLVWSPNFDVVQPQDLNQDGKMDFILYNST
jgi:hypothetical protein